MRVDGLTLVELVASLAIVAITITIAAPNLSSLLARQQVTAQRDELMRSLYAARSLAVLKNRHVSVCPGDARGCTGSSEWEYGWVVFEDPDGDKKCQDVDANAICDLDGGRILRTVPAPSSKLTIRGNHWVEKGVRFDSRGQAGWNNGTLTVCHPWVEAARSALVIAVSGRPRTASTSEMLACP